MRYLTEINVQWTFICIHMYGHSLAIIMVLPRTVNKNYRREHSVIDIEVLTASQNRYQGLTCRTRYRDSYYTQTGNRGPVFEQ